MYLNKSIIFTFLSITFMTSAIAIEGGSDENQVTVKQVDQEKVIFKSASGNNVDAAKEVDTEGVLNLFLQSLMGSIPKEISKLTHLTKIYLATNHLTGTIPKEIGQLTNLTTLDLSDNNLEGSIPKEIGDLTHLKELYLSHNRFTGKIPQEIGNLPQLTKINLSNNNLEGDISKGVLRSNVLNTIYLQNNQLTGFDGSSLGKAGIKIHNNPIQTFMTNPNSRFTLYTDQNFTDGRSIHIHFDGNAITTEQKLSNFHDVLQENVVGSYSKATLRIGFYKGDGENPHPISPYLQNLGVNHDTVILKASDGTITVEGLNAGHDAQLLVEILEKVRGRKKETEN